MTMGANLNMLLLISVWACFAINFPGRVSAAKSTLNFVTASLPSSITPEVMDNILGIIDLNVIPPLNPQAQLRIRKFLRAAFHDCMGGCDGSLNLFATENRGLEGFTSFMTNFYTQGPNASYLQAYLSRADFWVLSEQRALSTSIKRGVTPLAFRNDTPAFVYGRGDNPFGSGNDNK